MRGELLEGMQDYLQGKVIQLHTDHLHDSLGKELRRANWLWSSSSENCLQDLVRIDLQHHLHTRRETTDLVYQGTQENLRP